MQLSKAINVGIVPGRLHSIILLFYFISNFAYCCWMDFTLEDPAAIMAEIRGRSGHLAVVNMVVLFLLAGRNNPLIPLLRISFDTFNLFHRWIGRIVIVESIVHTATWAINIHIALGWSGVATSVQQSPFLIWGIAGTASMVIILFQTPSAVRHAAYETFLHVHPIPCSGSTACGSLPRQTRSAPTDAIYHSDHRPVVVGEVSPPGAHHLQQPFSSLRSHAGDRDRSSRGSMSCRLCAPSALDTRARHACLRLPTIRLSLDVSSVQRVAWTQDSHRPRVDSLSEKLPTTMSASLQPALPRPANTPTTVTLIMSARTGMTRSLYNRARATPTGVLRLRGALEGPYGGLESLHSYGTVVLFAGGVGITHQLGHVRAILAAHDQGTTCVRRCTLVWVVRSVDQLEWVRPHMDALLAMPGRRDVLRILMFVTKPKSKRDVVSASERVQMFAGRPNPAVLVEKEFKDRVGAMSVGVCGPGALADDVRSAVRDVVEEGKCDFWEESFTW